MDKIDFPGLLKSIGEELQARVDRASIYKHPSGVGDAREDVVREYLQQVLSPRFIVDRGKIFDSDGNLSREFDVIISEKNDVAPAMSLASRRIVPIEAVYGIIEVKSSLKRIEYETFINAVNELNGMRRYYLPLDQTFDPVTLQKLQNGVGPQDDLPNGVGWIWSGIIAFDAPQGEALCDYLASCCKGFWFICVPDRELVTMSFNPQGFRGIPFGSRSLPLTIWVIMDLVSQNIRPKSFAPDFSRYRSQMLKALGDHVGWECKFLPDQPQEESN